VNVAFTFCLDAKSNKKVKASEKQLKIFALRYVEEAKDGALEYRLRICAYRL